MTREYRNFVRDEKNKIVQRFLKNYESTEGIMLKK